MENAPFKSFGFNYECDGKRYAFDILDVSEENAKRRAAAMANAEFVGELVEEKLDGSG